MKFRKLKKDPTIKTERALTKLLKATDWDETINTVLIPRASVPPRLYGLPKIHKEGCSLHPIVNMIGTAMYYIANNLAGLLKSLKGKTEAYVKNSIELVEVIDTLRYKFW